MCVCACGMWGKVGLVGHTVKHALHAVKTFGAELIVCKAAEELRNHDVHKEGRVPGTHVAFDDGDGIVPDGAVLVKQMHVGIGVLLDAYHADCSVCRFSSIEGSCDKRSPACSYDGNDTRQC